MSEIKYKWILTPCKNPLKYFGIDFFASLFHGSHPGREYYASLADIDQTYHHDEAVTVKTDVAFLFRQELQYKAEGSLIGFYQNPDPYSKQLMPTDFMREILVAIIDKHMGVFIETSSDQILNDIDLLKKIGETAPVAVMVPIGFSIDLIQKKIERFEPDMAHKLKLIHKLAQEQIPVGVIMKPVIPFINDTESNVVDILNKVKEAGARFVYPTFGIVLMDKQRNKFYQLIDNEFPGLKNIYMDTFGNRKSLASPNSGKLKKAFVIEAKKLKLIFGMKDIVKSIKPAGETQLKLF